MSIRFRNFYKKGSVRYQLSWWFNRLCLDWWNRTERSGMERNKMEWSGM